MMSYTDFLHQKEKQRVQKISLHIYVCLNELSVKLTFHLTF